MTLALALLAYIAINIVAALLIHGASKISRAMDAEIDAVTGSNG